MRDPAHAGKNRGEWGRILMRGELVISRLVAGENFCCSVLNLKSLKPFTGHSRRRGSKDAGSKDPIETIMIYQAKMNRASAPILFLNVPEENVKKELPSLGFSFAQTRHQHKTRGRRGPGGNRSHIPMARPHPRFIKAPS